MSGLEGVPLKMPLCTQEEAGSVSTPEITLPDYLSILQDTEYEFSLETRVLTGLDGGCLRLARPPAPRCPSPAGAALPSCPPYWLMFSSPQQSRLAGRYGSDLWQPDPRPRSNSLNPADLPSRPATAGPDRGALPRGGPAPAGTPLRESARKAPKAFKPSLLNPPACLSSLPHQRRKNLRQCSLSVLDTRGALQGGPAPGTPDHAAPPPGATALSSSSSSSALRRPLRARASTLDRVGSTAEHRAPHPTPWVELLSALSPEERELLRAITDRGYPLHTALIALQKTGQQPPDQIFSYLGACEHLCEQGYDKAQVEEALEMFQNSETKAEEFLNLLYQFNEMGFQLCTIKEVLLVHDNHRERALEELMMRVA